MRSSFFCEVRKEHSDLAEKLELRNFLKSKNFNSISKLVVKLGYEPHRRALPPSKADWLPSFCCSVVLLLEGSTRSY